MLLTSSRMPQSARFDDLVQEFPLGHLGLVKLRVAADVFDRDGNLEEVLRPGECVAAVVFARLRRCTAAAADRGCIVRPRCPSKDDRRATEFWCAGSVSLRRLRCSRFERLGRAEIHGDAVLHDAILLENLVEYLQRTAAIDHVVFGDDFEPVDDRLF